jgi:hypothetical protein
MNIQFNKARIKKAQKVGAAGLLASSFALIGAYSHTAVAETLAIDLFTAGQVAADVANGGAGDSQSTATGIISILGGQRDINANVISGSTDDFGTAGLCDVGDSCATLIAAGSNLRFNNETGVVGSAIIQWDGDDQDITLNPTGLGGFDMTVGGRASALDFEVQISDQAFVFTIEAYTDATHYMKYTIASTLVAEGFPVTRTIPYFVFETPAFCGNPGATGDPQILAVECGSGGVADFTNLGALQVQLNVPDPDTGTRTTALDMIIGDIEAPLEDCCEGEGTVAPTGATCEDFVNNRPLVSGGLPLNLASFDMTVDKGKIFNVSNPGAAFYFTRFDASGDIEVDIIQDSTGGPDYEMDLTSWQLFSITDDGTGSGDLACDVIEQDNHTRGTDLGPLGFTGLNPAEYAMRIRMDPKSLKGEVDPGDNLTNDFTTFVDGFEVDSDPDGVVLERMEK